MVVASSLAQLLRSPMHRILFIAAPLLASGMALSGCGPLSGVMLVGNIVNAAGIAVVDASNEAREARGEAERERGIDEHLAWMNAESGDSDGAYKIATLLSERHDPDAMRWMCEAARGGHPRAQLQVGHWYNEDRRREDLWPFIGVSPDDDVAYQWYTAALDNGEDRAFIFRESLSYTTLEAEARSGVSTSLPACGGRSWQLAPRQTLARGA